MLLALLKSNHAFRVSFRCRQAAAKFAGATNFNSCRFASGGSEPGPRKKESEIKFSPYVPPDKYLDRRKAKFYEQFASKEGKTSSPPPPSPSTSPGLKWFYAVLFGGFIGFVFKILPHSLARDVVASILQQHEPDGSKTKVSSSLELLIRDVMADVDMSPEKVTVTRAFINSSDDQTSSLGGYKMSKGLLIGLPQFMNYNSAEDVPVDRLNFTSAISNPEDVKVRKALDDFLANVVLSDDAKKFLIAREIFRGVHSRQLYEATFPVAVLGVAAPLLHGIKSGLASTNILVKGFVSFASLSTLILVYLWLGDFWRRRTEKILDASAAQLGPSCARGGVEFYDKTLHKHVAMRELLPKGRGKKLYNLRGESYPPLLRDKHVPISKRRDHCKTFLNDSI